MSPSSGWTGNVTNRIPEERNKRRSAMAKTVIGLFEDPREAQPIVQALADDGFRREDIRTLTRPEEASVGTLSAHGVPDAEAQAYADAVRRGGALVLVDTADERADRAVALMEGAPAGGR